MTSKKSSSYNYGTATPLDLLLAVCSFIVNGTKTAIEFERMLGRLEAHTEERREAAKKILAVALRPTRKRRVNADQFEFKN